MSTLTAECMCNVLVAQTLVRAMSSVKSKSSLFAILVRGRWYSNVSSKLDLAADISALHCMEILAASLPSRDPHHLQGMPTSIAAVWELEPESTE